MQITPSIENIVNENLLDPWAEEPGELSESVVDIPFISHSEVTDGQNVNREITPIVQPPEVLATKPAWDKKETSPNLTIYKFGHITIKVNTNNISERTFEEIVGIFVFTSETTLEQLREVLNVIDPKQEYIRINIIGFIGNTVTPKEVNDYTFGPESILTFVRKSISDIRHKFNPKNNFDL
jgi:hypothetical protein